MSTLEELLIATWETLYMVFFSSLIASIIGIPLGMLLFTTRPGGILQQRLCHLLLGAIVNAVRSIPFIILLVAMVPLTRFIIGSTIGTTAAMVPLIIGAIAFIARIVENALAEVPAGLTEAGLSMGASSRQIMWKILFPEALPSIINGLTVTIIAIISFSAMAGTVGGGGLGDLGIRYGYQRFDIKVMLLTIIILIAMVQSIQYLGDYLSRQCNKNLTHRKHRGAKVWLLSAVIAIMLLFSVPNIIQWLTPNQQTVIKVGCMAGPEHDLMQTAADVMQKSYGVKLQLVPFSDYVMPNEALNSGNLDANYFQTLPYLKAQIKARGYQLSAIAKVFLYPIGVYSKKIAHIDDIKPGATVTLSNDPSNEARALLLLQKAGLIQLRHGGSITSSVSDIISNPRQLRIITLDGAQLPRSLSDVDIAVINNTFASAAGLHLRDAIFVESTDSNYVNYVVVRTQDKHKPVFHQLIMALRSKAVVDKAHELFGDGAVAGWQSVTA